jgi:hypothetical protein
MSRHQDIFGGIKIPRIEALNSSCQKDGWKEVPSVLSPDHFSSMLGFQVVGLPRDVETYFNLESTYFSTQCKPFVQLPYSINFTHTDVDRIISQFNYNFSSTAAKGLMPGRSPHRSFSNRRIVVAAGGPFNFDRFQAYMAADSPIMAPSDPRIVAPRWFVFGALYGVKRSRSLAINLTNCTLSETHVESAVYCPRETDGGDCRAQKMRLSLTDTRPPSLTLFDNSVLEDFINHSLPSYFLGNNYLSSSLEYFLDGKEFSGRMIIPENSNETVLSVDLSRLQPEEFSRRLSILLNTLVQQLFSYSDDALSTDLHQYGNVSTPAKDMTIFSSPPKATISKGEFIRFYNATQKKILSAMVKGLPFVPIATTATAMVRTPVYVCHFIWLSVLLVASVILFATGAGSLALKLRGTLAPDMLRYVANLTYSNPHFRTPPGGIALDGMERTKLLHNVRMRIGDINGGGDVGEIAFVAADEVETRRLEHRRLYL